MNVGHLVSMANQIGRFYEAYPNRSEALQTTATHLRRFWDPRMRAALLRHVDAEGGKGLEPFTLEAVRAHRDLLTPNDGAGRPK
jgi:formate dehydrogenase subunit delta